MSRPIQPSGIASAATTCVGGVGLDALGDDDVGWAARARSRARRRRPSRCRAISCPSASSCCDAPTATPRAARNVKAIAPPTSTASARPVNRSMTPILSATFDAADHHHERVLGLLEDAVERLELGRQQQPGRARQEVRHARRRGVGAVHGAERVVHEDVGERRQLGGERRVVLLLARVEAQVLEQAHRPRLAVERRPARRAARTGARRRAAATAPAAARPSAGPGASRRSPRAPCSRR